MKKVILFLLFIISINLLFSQERFVKRFQLSHDSIRIDVTPRNIIFSDSSYYLIGGYFNYSDTNPKVKVGIYKFSRFGNYQLVILYGDSIYNYAPQKGFKNLKKSHDGNYFYLTLRATTNFDTAFNKVFKFTPSFDTIWTLTFNVEWLSAHDIIEDTASNLIFVGPTQYLDNGDTVTSTVYLGLMKLDTIGNFIWRHCYDTLNYGTGEYIWIDTTNNHYWVGGKVNYHPGIYEVNQDGNLLWLHEFSSDYYIMTDAMNLLPLPSPYGVLAYCDRLWAQVTKASYSAIIKNHDIDKEWYYAPGLSSYHPSVAVSTISADNNILISEGGGDHVADSIVPLTTKYSYIYKTTLNGKFLWRRRFFAPIDNNSLSKFPSPIDFENTPDGGFAGTGCGVDSVYFGILAKFDSLGCNGYYSCADTAMVLSLLSPIDTVCTDDTLWMNFNIDGLSAPYTLYSSTGDTIKDIYHPFSPTVFSSSSLTDSTQYISYDIYQQYGFVPPDTNTGTYHLTITLEGAYGRRLSHTYDIPVKDCSVDIIAQSEIAQLSVFPNPATNGVVNIEATLTEPAFLSLYDNTGKSLQTMRLEPGTHTYQIKQTLPEGLYFVSIWNEKGSVVKKLIIN